MLQLSQKLGIWSGIVFRTNWRDDSAVLRLHCELFARLYALTHIMTCRVMTIQQSLMFSHVVIVIAVSLSDSQQLRPLPCVQLLLFAGIK